LGDFVTKPKQISAQIAALGTSLGPDVLGACKALFDNEQRALADQFPALASDLAYGPHERQRLDIYAPASGGDNLPVLMFVHGGGFLKGDKGGAAGWQNAHVGRMAAQAGFIGVVINYRLAPDHIWPSGGEDVGLAADWLKVHIAGYGGDPDKIFLIGTSAGAVHISTFLQMRNDSGALIKGAILLSGLYGYTPLDERDTLYYGDAALYRDRMPLEAVASTTLPLLVACGQYDPPRFQEEFLGLLQDRLARHGAMLRSYIASGHNHYSMAMHLGTSDQRLTDEIIDFINIQCKQPDNHLN
jgi:acetyl esterase/lipase